MGEGVELGGSVLQCGRQRRHGFQTSSAPLETSWQWQREKVMSKSCDYTNNESSISSCQVLPHHGTYTDSSAHLPHEVFRDEGAPMGPIAAGEMETQVTPYNRVLKCTFTFALCTHLWLACCSSCCLGEGQWHHSCALVRQWVCPK